MQQNACFVSLQGYDEQQPSAGDHLRWFTAKEQK
jgi:hypothetical protein